MVETPEPAAAGPTADGRRLLRWALAGFFLTAAGLFAAASLIAPDEAPGFPLTDRAAPRSDGSFVLTADVKDPERWVGVDLDLGETGPPGVAAELLLRRYLFQAPGGALDLGEVPFETAAVPEGARFTDDVEIDGIRQNTALARWYTYGYTSHLLSPKGHVYAVRNRAGDTLYVFEVLSYYCEPEGSGCLTLRYRIERSPGSPPRGT